MSIWLAFQYFFNPSLCRGTGLKWYNFDAHYYDPQIGWEIMNNILSRYIAASPIGKKQIIGSIFAEKLIFSENKFRTTEPNIFLELISRPIAGSDDYKKQKVGDFSDLSALVPLSDFRSNLFMEDLEKIYKLKSLLA